MKTGIVILNYNDYETTKYMLDQIKNFKSLDHIIIVNNCPNDKASYKLKKYENEKIKIIETKENTGYSSGNNFGIKYLISHFKIDYIIISNPDIILKDSDIENLKKDLDENKNIDLISPNIIQHGEIFRGWKLPTFLDDLLSNINFVQRYSKKRLLYDDKNYNKKLTKVDVVSGCFFIIRKKSLEKVNYFDENTFLYYEENILGKKLKDNNMNTYVDNEIKVIHNLSVSIDKSINSLKKYKILKDSQRYYEKEYNKLNIFGIILLRLTYYISYIISFLYHIIRSFGGKK